MKQRRGSTGQQLAAGLPPTGRIRLRACAHEQGPDAKAQAKSARLRRRRKRPWVRVVRLLGRSAAARAEAGPFRLGADARPASRGDAQLRTHPSISSAPSSRTDGQTRPGWKALAIQPASILLRPPLLTSQTVATATGCHDSGTAPGTASPRPAPLRSHPLFLTTLSVSV
ncbi:uncharacterized protein PSFLO_00838 [Pseudozyma flocculosa]|uniref:Uncharacterized protein n=1 Tax=Pseudozyma flocculosa TaxID=84751 RepID=A0A5C3EV67_9BASI|nr:uncharacterized protein PSFLO_00838 [Pseudozyma flocculosa]